MTTRRRFLGLAGTGAAALGVGAVSAGTATPAAAQGSARPAKAPYDLRWLDELGGRHRQVFDLGRPDLMAVGAYLRAFRDVYDLEHPDVVAVVGIAGYSFPVNVGDAAWEKYELGRRWGLPDRQTGEPATHNIFLREAPAEAPIGIRDAALPQLIARGVRFWQCDNALNSVIDQLAAETKRDRAEVDADLRAALHPWVHLVPAHVMCVGLLQERGFAYEHLM